MKISVLCTDENHPVNDYLYKWIGIKNKDHQIELVRKKSNLSGGDILFLISCSEIIEKKDRDIYKKSLIIHASDLPKGRGWSPHIWEIINGAELLTLSLLEAEDKVDSGRIWKKKRVHIPKDFLWDEINTAVFEAEIELMDYAVENFCNVEPLEQEGDATYYKRRKPEDSKLDINRSILEQFDRIRVCDPDRFPAFFDINGFRYSVKLEKIYRD